MSTESVLAGGRRFFVGVGDVLDVLRTVPDGSVHCCVTSPPYWGLRDYGTPGQIGLEPTPAAFVAKMVEVFREVKRALRDDGTLWLNLGDSYAGSQVARDESSPGRTMRTMAPAKASVPGLAAKQLLGMPWRVAFALQEDGWYLRSAITWCKKACMPESVTDRPTSATEMVFLLAKKPSYFFDQEAVREPVSGASDFGKDRPESPMPSSLANAQETHHRHRLGNGSVGNPAGRNLRNFWLLGPDPFPESHFAVMPTEIPRRAILAGTSEKGCCPSCGAPWRRVTEATRTFRSGSGRSGNLPVGKNGAGLQGGGATLDVRRGPTVSVETIGWAPSCACDAGPPVPAVVLDCFSGAGTTGLVALRLGRRYLGAELNPEYAAMSERRILDDQGATAAEVGNVEQPVQLRLGVA